ncbi:MAG: hypothetical protein U0175_26350 [Caldilineaceae bacterium]
MLDYVTIVDNKGRSKTQRVEYTVEDVLGEKIYVTFDGLAYAQDSLTLKRQQFLIDELHRLSSILRKPDLVIWDPVDAPGETLIYYKRTHISALQTYKVLSVIIKVRQDIRFFYNFFLQESGKVKGLPIVSPSEIEICYTAPGVKRSQFGL